MTDAGSPAGVDRRYVDVDTDFASSGFRVYAFDPVLAQWAEHARTHAERALAEPRNDHWYRHGRTWFVGVDCLPNDPGGRLPDGPRLEGAAIRDLSPLALHPAQVSAVMPGYPKRDRDESEAQHRYRLVRDGAHIDGLLPVGPERRRKMREPHAFVLGIALTDTVPEASPLVVWEGSQTVLRAAFQRVLTPRSADTWGDADLTDVYLEARKTCFKTCRRVEVPLKVGEAVLLDPLTLHGIAPWSCGAGPARITAYFRPLADHPTWLSGDGRPSSRA